MNIQMVLLPVFVQVGLTFALMFGCDDARGSLKRGEAKIARHRAAPASLAARPTQVANCSSQLELPLLSRILASPRLRLPARVVAIQNISAKVRPTCTKTGRRTIWIFMTTPQSERAACRSFTPEQSHETSCGAFSNPSAMSRDI